MKTRILFLVFGFIFSLIPANAQTDWQTPAEKTDYKTTPRLRETIEYLKRLEKSSKLIKFTNFGLSGENREMPLVIAAKDNAFTPEIARKQKKVIILIQACIHAGESDGKDAGLALLRDIVITKTRQNLLDNVVIMFEPIYNVDGHERFGAFNRINQNGPEKTGFRPNATNLNLNRDYIKADAPETRAWLKLWNIWRPDFFIDCHVTDGADYRYNLTYQFEHNQTTADSIKNWIETAFDKRIVPNTEKAGNTLAPYLEFRDGRDLSKGFDEFLSTPRYATCYPILRNRPAVLIETHMLKPYKNRVLANYDFIRFIIEDLNQNKTSLLEAIKQAEAETSTAF
ncbi:MAG: M14 family metallopeptidase, partial [Pyrinomonadaceae bacterium]|nr:M14 family metallopeptidase [Pyrinomonadaceae bacterium]